MKIFDIISDVFLRMLYELDDFNIGQEATKKDNLITIGYNFTFSDEEIIPEIYHASNEISLKFRESIKQEAKKLNIDEKNLVIHFLEQEIIEGYRYCKLLSITEDNYHMLSFIKDSDAEQLFFEFKFSVSVKEDIDNEK